MSFLPWVIGNGNGETKYVHYPEDDSVVRLKQTELFPAVQKNRIEVIRKLINVKKLDINAVDICGRNALQVTVDCCSNLTEETCKVLFEMGLDVDHKNNEGNTVLANIVCFYDINSNKSKLDIIRCLIEAGANLDEEHHGVLKEWTFSIRERMKTYPEMIPILQEASAKAANAVFQIIQGEAGITSLICEIAGRKPSGTWKPLEEEKQ